MQQFKRPFNPREFLYLSNCLCSDSAYDNESKYRTSISRAYYATFLVSREYLITNMGVNFSKDGREHQEVIEKIKGINETIGINLETLRLKRNKADYVLEEPIKQRKAIRVLQCAQDIIDAIDNDTLIKNFRY